MMNELLKDEIKLMIEEYEDEGRTDEAYKTKLLDLLENENRLTVIAGYCYSSIREIIENCKE